MPAPVKRPVRKQKRPSDAMLLAPWSERCSTPVLPVSNQLCTMPVVQECGITQLSFSQRQVVVRARVLGMVRDRFAIELRRFTGIATLQVSVGLAGFEVRHGLLQAILLLLLEELQFFTRAVIL